MKPLDAVTAMFAAATERALQSGKLSETAPSDASGDSGDKARRRHEAMAQYMLDHIFRQPGELERFCRAFSLPSTARLSASVEHSWTERARRGRGSGSEVISRVDHHVSDDEGRTIAFIEDKIDAPFGIEQLARYERELERRMLPRARKPKLIVIVPERRLNSVLEEPASGSPIERTTISWKDLAVRMTDGASETGAARWRALAQFAENVGTGDLPSLGMAAPLRSREVATELHSTLLSAQRVVRALRLPNMRQLQFSFNGTSTDPWLQTNLTSRTAYGFDLDVSQDAGMLYLGRRRTDGDFDWATTKVGFFDAGELTSATQNRLHARECRKPGSDLRAQNPGWAPVRAPAVRTDGGGSPHPRRGLPSHSD